MRHSSLPHLPAENNQTLLGDWFVNALRFGPTKILLFTNAQTLYSLLVEYKKKDLSDVGQLFRTGLKTNLLAEGVAAEKVTALLTQYQQVVLAQTDNRSVLGSMNDLASIYKYWMMARGGFKQTDLAEAMREINRTPQLKRDGHYSIDLLREALRG